MISCVDFRLFLVYYASNSGFFIGTATVLLDLFEINKFFLPFCFQDFGSIFSTLLPGTTAKLAPPEGQTELDGLEVKVAFGNVWKESLSELSGGQR